MTKSEHRRMLRELPELPPSEVEARSNAICEQIRVFPEWQKARMVGLYSACHHEPSLNGLWLNDGTRLFAFPRVNGAGLDAERVHFYRIAGPEDLHPTRWGLREPNLDCEEVDAGNLDLVIVPGVAFTAAGARLGRGRGHYDRFLPRLRPDCTVIGVCFRERLLAELPTEAHDIPMRRVVVA